MHSVKPLSENPCGVINLNPVELLMIGAFASFHEAKKRSLSLGCEQFSQLNCHVYFETTDSPSSVWRQQAMEFEGKGVWKETSLQMQLWEAGVCLGKLFFLFIWVNFLGVNATVAPSSVTHFHPQIWQKWKEWDKPMFLRFLTFASLEELGNKRHREQMRS